MRRDLARTNPKLIPSRRYQIGNTYDTTWTYGRATAISESGDVRSGLARRGPQFRAREVPLRGSHCEPRAAAEAFGRSTGAVDRGPPRQTSGLEYRRAA